MYYSLLDVQFWLFGLLSIVAVVVSCYFPGWLLLKKAALPSKLTETAAATAVGVSLWAAQGYLFGHLQLRSLTYFYLVLVIFLVWKNRSELLSSFKATKKEVLALPVIELVAILVACVFQLYAHIGSGLVTEKGVGFNFVNSADGMLHLGYIDSMTQNFPPLEPGLAGTYLTNYHYWSDLVFAEFARVWQLPVIHLFFQYLPPVLILTTTILFVQLIKHFKGTTTAILVGLFLLTFGADAAFIFSLYFNRIWGAHIPALDTGVTFIFNMPQVFSRLAFLAACVCLLQWIKNKNRFSFWIMILVAASLFGLKIYYGFYFITGLGFLSLYLFRKNIFKSFFVYKELILGWVILAMLIAAIYLPNNKGAGGVLYEPLAWPKVFLSDSHLNYRDWWLRMQVYEEANNIRNMFIYNALAIGITLVSVHGIRLLGLLPVKKTISSIPQELLFFFIPTNIIFLIVGFTFFQVSGGLNIYNFLIVPILSFNIFAALNISSIKDPFYKWVVVALLISLCMPRSVLQLKEFFSVYYSRRPSEVVSHQELELLSYIRKNADKDDIVQADPKNQYEFVTPYVSYFTGQAAYLGGRKLLETHNLPIQEKAKIVDDLFVDLNPGTVANKMRDLQIMYLYVTDPGITKMLVTSIQPDNPHLAIVVSNDAGLVVALK